MMKIQEIFQHPLRTLAYTDRISSDGVGHESLVELGKGRSVLFLEGMVGKYGAFFCFLSFIAKIMQTLHYTFKRRILVEPVAKVQFSIKLCIFHFRTVFYYLLLSYLLTLNYLIIIFGDIVRTPVITGSKMGVSAIPKMDLKSQANSPTYLKSLIFTKKEFSIVKLIEILPYINSSLNDRLKITYMKIFPVVFSYSELNRVSIKECIHLIYNIQKHPFFKHERSLFDGWSTRLRSLLPVNHSYSYKHVVQTTSSAENTFINVGSNMYDIIGYAELDLFYRYHKWLKYHKLHKYLYFFAALSYVEIQSINKENIEYFEEKVGIHPMTEGARNAILRKLEELHQRQARLEVFSKEEYYTSISKIDKSIQEIRTMLKTPVRRNQMFSSNNLPDLLSRAIETVVFVILRRVKGNDLLQVYQPAVSLLKMAWGCAFFETAAKNKLNLLQHALHTKVKNHSRKMKEIRNNRIKDIYAVQLDIENGIRAMTWYLENVVLKEY